MAVGAVYVFAMLRNKEALLMTVGTSRGNWSRCVFTHLTFVLTAPVPVSSNGQPPAASPERALRILKYVQELSGPFGASIAFENSVEVIQVRH